MTAGKVLDGKPYVGKTHVRFDAGVDVPARSGRFALLHKVKWMLLFGVIALVSNLFAAYKTITVTFDANGGNGGTTRYLSCQGEYEDGEWWYDYVELEELPTPTRNGWLFAGWWTEATGGYRVLFSTTVSYDASCYQNEVYAPIGSYARAISTRGNVRLYAHWTKNLKATDIFLWSGGMIYGMWEPPSGILEIPSQIDGYTVMWFGESPCVVPIGDSSTAFNFTHVTSFSLPDTLIYLSRCDFEGSKWWDNQNGPVAGIGGWAIGLKNFDGTRLVIPSEVKKIAGNFAYRIDWEPQVPLLQSVQFPEGLSHILEQAFYGQTKLKNVYVPASVEYIGDSAFADVPGPFYFQGNRPKIYACGSDLDDTGRVSAFSGRAIVYFKANTKGWKDGGKWAGAKMKKWPTVKVSFNANGGKCSTRSRNCYKTDKYSTLPSPTRTGYTFLGWYSKKSGGTKITEASKVPSTATTLYAHWRINTYTVTLSDGWNGLWGSVTRKHGAKVGTLPTPSMDGYKFLGWYTAAQGGTKVSTKAKVTKNVTYYAHWTLAYAVKGGVIAQGGAKGSIILSEKDGKVKVGSTMTLTAKAKDSNSLFSYWTDVNGNIVSYATTLKVKPTGNVSYEAVFRTKAGCAKPSFDSENLFGPNGHASLNNMVGVVFNAQMTVNEAAYPIKFSTKGLPPGLKMNATSGVILGVPTKSGTFMTTITATSVANTKNRASKKMLFTIAPLPGWVRGNFNGTALIDGRFVGSAKLSVAVNGKMSGKIVAGGTNWTFSASGYAAASDSTNGIFVVSGTATRKVGKATAKEAWTLRQQPSNSNFANTLAIGDIGSSLTFEAQRNFWLDTGAAALIADLVGDYDWYTEDGERLRLTLDAKGNVKVAGTLKNGRKLTFSTPLWYYDNGACDVLIYAPKQTVTVKSGKSSIKKTYPEFIAVADLIADVTFDANGGTGGTALTRTYDTALGVLPTPKRDGYSFGGWWTEANGGTQVESSEVVKSDTTYYAHWSINNYTVIFDANGGTGGKTITRTHGMTLGTLPTPTCDGHSFEGWWTKIKGGEQVFDSTKVLGDTTYYAHWSTNCYTVTFNANGGNGGVTTTQDYGTAINVPTVTREGYTFTGWSPVVEATVPASNVTYTAQWRINQYTVTFNANGGNGGVTTMQDYGTAITAPVVTREGFTFMGWLPTVATTVPATNVTYIAQWEVENVLPQGVTTWYVNGSTGTDSNSGISESAPMATIQAAIDASGAGDTILVAAGTYTERIELSKTVIVKAVSGAQCTTIHGQTGYAVVRILEGASNSVIDGFEITGGTGDPNPSSYGYDYYGGGVRCRTSATVRNCIIHGNGHGTPRTNSGTFGGGISSTSGKVLVADCLLYDNFAWACGGATFVESGDGEMTLLNCTIYGNDSTNFLGYQGGVGVANGATVKVKNCIVWNNGGNQIDAFAGYNSETSCEVSYSCVQGGVTNDSFVTLNLGTGNINVSPDFHDAANGDYRLAAASPCIDAGDNSYVATTTDLAGNVRIANGTVDIGCYEYGAVPLASDEESLYCIIDLSAGTNAVSYPVTYMSTEPSGGFNADEYKTTKLVLRRVEPGSFMMGGASDVTLTKAYYIGVFEVTQKQYELVMGANPSQHKGVSRPVEMVSYDVIRGSSNGANWPLSSDVDSTSFMGKLRARTGLDFDLPTEAQWEYACRAGTTSDYNNGGSTTNDLNGLGRYQSNQSDGRGGYSANHTTVGTYSPNAWGLYDMHGNVWEWCLDWSGALSGGTDPEGPSTGTGRRLRGGSWYVIAASCTSSSRTGSSSALGHYHVGFRLSLPGD